MSKELGPVAKEIKSRLEAEFKPDVIEVIDESEQHIGHAGYREGGESHFQLIIKAPSLSAYSRIEKHKKIYACLGDLMKDKIHALSIRC